MSELVELFAQKVPHLVDGCDGIGISPKLVLEYWLREWSKEGEFVNDILRQIYSLSRCVSETTCTSEIADIECASANVDIDRDTLAISGSSASLRTMKIPVPLSAYALQGVVSIQNTFNFKLARPESLVALMNCERLLSSIDMLDPNVQTHVVDLLSDGWAAIYTFQNHETRGFSVARQGRVMTERAIIPSGSLVLVEHC